MRVSRIAVVLMLVVAATSGIAQASWYDDYDAGLAAARKGQWSVVEDRMSKAIAANGTENNRARAYGTIFYNYHPYYYRGVARLNLGKYEQAITDLEKTTGVGPENLGTIDMLLQMAKTKAAQASDPGPAVPEPQPVRPVPAPTPAPQPVIPAPQPAGPVIDAALRGRAQSAVQQARARLQAAQDRDASSTQQYQRALQHFTEANTKLATAKSNDDLNAVIAMADNAILIADSAVAAQPAIATTRPNAATATVLADSSRRVRVALESYFRGDFDEASSQFARLAQDMPTNAWIWAFLGASQYSQYAFEADEHYRTQALDAFRKARQYGKWGRDGLPSKYFSRRIRRAFNESAG
jgi:tetratricopeptide (TPR) repeat protein